jgi:hypothetical protein
MDKNEEYIQTLNEKNRLKKMMRAKSEQEKVMEDRERGLLFIPSFRSPHASTLCQGSQLILLERTQQMPKHQQPNQRSVDQHLKISNQKQRGKPLLAASDLLLICVPESGGVGGQMVQNLF